MADLNYPLMMVTYLVPIAYGLGLVRGYQRATGAEVNHVGTLWLIFWPAALVAIAWIELRKRVEP